MEAFKNYLADFFRKGGGVAPPSTKGFWQDKYLLRGGGTLKFRCQVHKLHFLPFS